MHDKKSQTALATVSKLNEMHWTALDYPPRLMSRDIHFLRLLKKVVRGQTPPPGENVFA